MLRRSLRLVGAIALRPQHLKIRSSPIASSIVRFSSTSSQTKETNSLSKKLLDEDEYDDYEEAKTLPQKLRWYGIFMMRLGILMIGTYCVYLTGVELFPGRMGPGNLFNTAFELVRYNAEVISMAGEGMKAFGKDVGRHTEGRRSHVESFKYMGEDGSKRTRIRFNVKGNKGKVVVWAEVCEAMQPGDLVYLICQDTRTGKVYTVIDNRSMLDNRSPAGPASTNPFLAFFQGNKPQHQAPAASS